MKSKIAFWISVTITLILLFFGIFIIFQEKTKIYNFVPSNIHQSVRYPKNVTYNILKGKEVDFEFDAKYNNLGETQFLFDGNERTNTDVIIFGIREKGSGNWYYQNSYSTAKIASGQFYTFGFPLISNSKGKTYELKIFSTNGSVHNSISLSKTVKEYQAIYNFPLSFLKQNKNFISVFLFQKVENYLASIYFSDLIFLTFWLAASAILTFSAVAFVEKLSGFAKFKLYFKNTITKNYSILLLIFLYILSHIQFLSYSQYWDAEFYYNVIVSVSKHIGDSVHFFQNFNILGHPSMGYTTLLAISQNIQNDNVYLLNIENLILAVLAIFAFYKIFLFFFKDRKLEAILTTAIFAFNPLFYATSISLNLDFPVLVFEVLAVYSFLYKKNLSFVIWSILLIFSKETGFLIYGSFIGGYLLISEIKRLVAHKNKFDYKKYLVFIIPVFLFVLYLFSNHWKLWSNQGPSDISTSASFVWNNNEVFSFGINSINIYTRLVQMFVMNFGWLLSLVVLASLIKSLLLREDILEKMSGENKDFIRMFIFVMLIFTTFNLIYIVMPFSRYVVENVFFFSIISYVSLNYLIPKSKKWRIVILLIVSSLFVIQTFKAIDPSVNVLYGNKHMSENISSLFFGMADGLVYNAQFAYLDKLSDLIIKETKGDYLIRDDANEYFFKNIPFQTRVSDITKIQNPKPDKIVYVHFPWFSDWDTDLNKLRKYYNVSYIKTLKFAGYTAELYSLEK